MNLKCASRLKNRKKSNWQLSFLCMLPQIEEQLHFAFRFMDPDAKEEAVQEGVTNCVVRYQRLVQQGRSEVASPTSLAGFAIRQIRSGRTVATKLSVRDPLSRYAQLRKHMHVERLDQPSDEPEEWVEVAVADKRAPIPEQVALRMDVRVWLRGLTRRTRLIARDLIFGWKTGELSRRYGISPARISQLRRQLYESWQIFQGTDAEFAEA